MEEINNKSQIHLLKWMLEDIRTATTNGIKDLTKEQLFNPPIEGEYPIGAYLMHLGECDLGWLQALSGEEQPEDLKKRVYYSAWFDVPKENYNPPASPIEPQEYIDSITEARKRFLDYMDKMTDAELEDKITIKHRESDHVITKKWIIYHILEHEAHTRGQMFMLIRMATGRKAFT